MRAKREWMLLGLLAAGVSAADDCADLAKPGLFPNTVVQSAKVVDAKEPLPAFCEVTALITPVAGSKITAVYRLPESWNGRMLGLGGGGWAGILNVLQPAAISGPFRAAGPGLTRGYATAQTDGGHSSPISTDASWTRNNPVAVTDFSHRAIHEMTVLGKQVVASHYGRAATKNYYQACSTGGRMGMMETQRYPDDYDGVVANGFLGTPTRFCVISFTSDWLFPTHESRAIVHALNAAGARVSFAEITTDKGHDAFLLDEPELFQIVTGFLDSAAAARGIAKV